MRRTVIALVVGGALVLPAGAALAGDQVPNGKAWGNCKHSSGGGNPHTALPDGREPANPGNGGFGGPVKRTDCPAPGQTDGGTGGDSGGTGADNGSGNHGKDDVGGGVDGSIPT